MHVGPMQSGVKQIERVVVVRVQVAVGPQNCLSKTCKSLARRVTKMWSKMWDHVVWGGFYWQHPFRAVFSRSSFLD
jgi:hypothetical protein